MCLWGIRALKFAAILPLLCLLATVAPAPAPVIAPPPPAGMDGADKDIGHKTSEHLWGGRRSHDMFQSRAGCEGYSLVYPLN